MPLILILAVAGGPELEASLIYMVSSRPARAA